MTLAARKKNGFTLVETAIVLTIVGLIIGGIWLGAATIQGNIKKNKLAEQTLRLAQNFKNFYTNNPNGMANFLGYRVDQMIDAGLIPDDMVKGDTNTPSIVHAFNGSVEISQALDNTGAIPGGGFTLSLRGVPVDACIDIITARIAGNTSTAKKIGFYGYGTTTYGPDFTYANGGIPATLATAKAACKTINEESGNNDPMVLYFDLN